MAELDFALQLTDRQPDRVLVSVLLSPESAEPVDLEGVEVMLVCPEGEPLSHRMLLPIAGRISQTMVSTVELRGHGPLPVGAGIAATAWCGCRQWEARIPADPGTQLEAHCRGTTLIRPAPVRSFGDAFEPLSRKERDALSQALPWLAPHPLPELRVVDDTTEVEREAEELRAYCEDLGLDDEATDWLEDLLNE
jgi:hypothetical protein